MYVHAGLSQAELAFPERLGGKDTGHWEECRPSCSEGQACHAPPARAQDPVCSGEIDPGVARPLRSVSDEGQSGQHQRRDREGGESAPGGRFSQRPSSRRDSRVFASLVLSLLTSSLPRFLLFVLPLWAWTGGRGGGRSPQRHQLPRGLAAGPAQAIPEMARRGKGTEASGRPGHGDGQRPSTQGSLWGAGGSRPMRSWRE